MKRKFISAILVCAMIISLGSAFAAELPKVSDIAMVEAVVDMHDLKIMVGDQNGNFRGNVAITRAETATVICRMLGLEQQAKDWAQAPSFSDTDGHWAMGYIEVAAKNGILKGNEDGTFAPDGEMSFIQVTQALVNALGYKDIVESSSLSVDDYISMGEERGLIEKAQFSPEEIKAVANEPALRSYVSMMVSTALNIPIPEAKSYNVTTGKTEYVILDGQNGTELKTLRKAVFNR